MGGRVGGRVVGGWVSWWVVGSSHTAHFAPSASLVESRPRAARPEDSSIYIYIYIHVYICI